MEELKEKIEKAKFDLQELFSEKKNYKLGSTMMFDIDRRIFDKQEFIKKLEMKLSMFDK